MSLLVFNAGSSSLKFALFDDGARERLASGIVDWGGGEARFDWTLEEKKRPTASWGPIDYAAAVAKLAQALSANGMAGGPIRAIGQRVVHGGTHFRAGTRITAAVKSEIERLLEIAPLHNPPALQAIRAAEAAFPGIPQTASFDTAYFQDLADDQYLYPVPYAWYEQWGIRRFGFHGVSHAYCARRAEERIGRADLRVVSCHLGQGCSVTASRGRRAIATTMGFTPLEGLMMGTRSGSIDPGILPYVQRRHGLSPEDVERILNRESGMKGICGSGDFRAASAAAAQGDERARLAMRMFTGRVRSAIGEMAVTLGGVDALVFTAGVGEHAAEVRESVCEGLACLGLRLDKDRNAAGAPDADIAQDGSAGRILVLHTEEERMIAEETAALIKKDGSSREP